MRQRPSSSVLLGLCLACLLGGLAGSVDSRGRQGQEQGPVASPAAGLQAFDLLSGSEGWLLAGGRLYWTKSGGQSWQEIGSGEWADGWIAAAYFVSLQQGWALVTRPDGAGGAALWLGRTADGGGTWQTRELSLLPPGDVDALVGAAFLCFVDPLNGWLVLRRASSSNFRVGALFRTADGGETWTRLAIPIGEPVRFVTAERGWVAGGPAGDQLHRSPDGGRTWSPEPAGGRVAAGEGRFYQLPTFSDGRQGLLPVVSSAGDHAEVRLYVTEDAGQSWQLSGAIPIEGDAVTGVPLAVSPLASGAWLVAMPGGRGVLRIAAGDEVQAVNESPLAAGIQELDMATTTTGWARHVAGSCAPGEPTGPSGAKAPAGGTGCRQEISLLRTEDGGASWRALALPESRGGLAGAAPAPDGGPAPTAAPLGKGDRVALFEGQGFDKCEVPSLSQLQTWQASSPYDAVNLYIGGISRGCPNSDLDAAFVAGADAQGWVFIPTWVGPQAACSSYMHRMSYDPAVAYSQGVAEADAAVAAAIDLGLALPDGSGSVIYYDLEAYDIGDEACREAANSFVWGWTVQLKARGNHAGMYGAACSSAVSDWAELPSVPDALWVAWWTYSYYDPGATVWDILCLDNSLWVDHQRLRQYTGGHDETWGDLALHIDCDVADGVVATLHGAGLCCGCGGEPASCVGRDCWPAMSPGKAAGVAGSPQSLGSDTHNAESWSRQPVVRVRWSPAGATDGLAGYALVWDQSPESEPDSVAAVEAGAAEASSPLLGTGAWYAHLRAVGQSGTGGQTLHSGPFLIDLTPPRAVTAAAALEGVWQDSPVPASFVWPPAEDVGSGVAGYLVYWGEDAEGMAETLTASAAFRPPDLTGPAPAATYYLRVAAVDYAGNWGPWQTVALVRYEPEVGGEEPESQTPPDYQPGLDPEKGEAILQSRSYRVVGGVSH